MFKRLILFGLLQNNTLNRLALNIVNKAPIIATPFKSVFCGVENLQDISKMDLGPYRNLLIERNIEKDYDNITSRYEQFVETIDFSHNNNKIRGIMFKYSTFIRNPSNYSNEEKECVYEIFKRARDRQVRIYVDAEDTTYLPLSHYQTLRWYADFNRNFPTLTITIQSYLNNAGSLLDQVLANKNYKSVKLVRGGYLSAEDSSVVLPSEPAVARQYDKLADKCMHMMKQHDDLEVLFGTHNPHAISNIVAHKDIMDRIVFGHLKGLGESSAKQLISSGYKVCTVYPVGNFSNLSLYFCRRLSEVCPSSGIGSPMNREWNDIVREFKEALSSRKM